MNYSILASQNQKRPQNIEIIGRSHNKAVVAPDAQKTWVRFFQVFMKAYYQETTQNDQGPQLRDLFVPVDQRLVG